MKVTFYGKVINYTDGKKSHVPGGCANLRALVDELGSIYGENFRAFLLGSETCFFLVNGAGAQSTGGLETPLKPGDKIEVLPFVEAG